MVIAKGSFISLRLSTLMFLATGLLTLPVCAQTSDSDPVTAQGSPSTANPRHETGSVESTAPAMRDRLFLREAVAGGLAEIQLGELAESRAGSGDVKQFAAEMIKDHTQINDGLRSVAESQGVMMPAKLMPRDQALYDRLKTLSGEDFDREYLKEMVVAHHKDLREFRSEAASTQDETLRTVVQDATTVIHRHMVAADQMARSKGIAIVRPARVGPAPQTPQ